MRKKGSKNKKKIGVKRGWITKDQKVLEDFVAANQSPIKATLKVLGRIYESKGNTIDEVLNNFKTEDWVKGAGVLIIEKDGVIREKIIAGNHIRNLFGMASGTMREISLKWVRSLFI